MQSQASPQAQTSDSTSKTDSQAASYVVLDLEMCKVPGTYRRQNELRMEIIEIGAALLNHEFQLVDQFDRYVKPEYGFIDNFIQNLTGINGYDVSKADPLKTVLQEFADWIPQDALLVSWSMTDREQLFGEMQVKNLQCPKLEEKYESWIDCQPMFAEKLNEERRFSLEEALVATDIITEGKAHSGLVDACNTALLFAKMNTEQEMKLNAYYKKAHEETDDSHLNFTLGDLFSNLL